MKKMLLTLISLVLTLNMVSFAAQAGDVTKGKEAYIKHLEPLFDDAKGSDITTAYMKVEWKKMFKKEAKRFIKTFSKKYPKSETFLKSEEFQKIAQDLKAFMMKYAADAGELPSCS